MKVSVLVSWWEYSVVHRFWYCFLEAYLKCAPWAFSICLRVWRTSYTFNVPIRFLLELLTHYIPLLFVTLPVSPIRVSCLSVLQATRHWRDGLMAVGAQSPNIAYQPWNEQKERLTCCTELCEWTACSMCVGPFPVAVGVQLHRKNTFESGQLPEASRDNAKWHSLPCSDHRCWHKPVVILCVYKSVCLWVSGCFIFLVVFIHNKKGL